MVGLMNAQPLEWSIASAIVVVKKVFKYSVFIVSFAVFDHQSLILWFHFRIDSQGHRIRDRFFPPSGVDRFSDGDTFSARNRAYFSWGSKFAAF